jgi:hypothetical protein
MLTRNRGLNPKLKRMRKHVDSNLDWATSSCVLDMEMVQVRIRCFPKTRGRRVYYFPCTNRTRENTVSPVMWTMQPFDGDAIILRLFPIPYSHGKTRMCA